MEAFWVTPANDAETVTGVVVATALLFTANAALVAPAGTVTLWGTVTAAVLLLERDTWAPPAGAVPFSVTTPEAGEPPTTLLGLIASAARAGPDAAGVTVSAAVSVTPPLAAEMVTCVELAGAMVATWNAAADVPAGTVTFCGTAATEPLLLDNETTVPPAGAGAVRVTLPVEGFPPETELGLSVSDATSGPPGAGAVVWPLPPPPQEYKHSNTTRNPAT